MIEENRPADGAEWWTLHTDGAARGNPGPAGAGAVLLDGQGRVLAELSRSLGVRTNNEAEYHGLLLGLAEVRRLGGRRLRLRLDSELVVRQLQGRYRVKHPHLIPLYRQAMVLLRELEVYDIMHVRRELNAEADALASKAAGQG
ncbi:MAG: ribonuclease HI family protein [Thermodesulfobacteriota bacterium]